MNAQDRLDQINKAIAALQAEKDTLSRVVQEPNHGAIVRWTDRDQIMHSARRMRNWQWRVSGSTRPHTWAELLELVDGQRLELADEFSTYVPATAPSGHQVVREEALELNLWAVMVPSVGKPCSDCGQVKPDVRLIADPFDLEINDRVTMVHLCDDCEGERAADV